VTSSIVNPTLTVGVGAGFDVQVDVNNEMK
jgi:hypothetical protein